MQFSWYYFESLEDLFNLCYIRILIIGGSSGRARCTPPPPYGTQFFHFHIHFHRKAPASEVGAPPPPTGNPEPGFATAVIISYELDYISYVVDKKITEQKFVIFFRLVICVSFWTTLH